jgi:hypothetical protein
LGGELIFLSQITATDRLSPRTFSEKVIPIGTKSPEQCKFLVRGLKLITGLLSLFTSAHLSLPLSVSVSVSLSLCLSPSLSLSLSLFLFLSLSQSAQYRSK